MDRYSIAIRTTTLILSACWSLALPNSVWAGAFPLTGTTSVSYSDPVGGSITPNGGSSVLTDSTSTLSSNGVSYNVNYNQPFASASISYFNGFNTTIPSEVNMQVGTAYTTAGGSQGTADFGFGLDLSKTSNGGVSLAVATQYSTGAAIGNDGSTTYMQFLGFGSSAGSAQNLSQTLTVNPLSKTSAYLWVQYLVVEPESQTPLPGGGALPSSGCCPSVPEPETWILGLMGCGLLGFVRWR